MATISHTTVSIALSWMKMHEFSMSPINNILTLAQIMAWHYKPLSELMMVELLMHIYVSKPQWINDTRTLYPYMISYSYVQTSRLMI